MCYMFQGATSFNQDISNWDVSGVTDVQGMFKDATSFNQNLSAWQINPVYYCQSFCNGAISWTLPKPDIRGCSYDNGPGQCP